MNACAKDSSRENKSEQIRPPTRIGFKSLLFIVAVIFTLSGKCRAEDFEHLGAMGTAAFRAKNFDEAIKCFTEAIDVNSNYVGAYYFRGLSYMSMTQYDNAIADLSHTLALNTNDSEAYYFRALCYRDKNQYDQVVADMDSALTYRTNAPYLLLRAYAYMDLTNFNGAIEDYTRVIHLDPASTDGYLDRAQAYRLEKVLGLAMMDCNAALRIKPTLPEGYQERGEILHDEGNYKDALSDYDTSLQLAPEDKSVYYLKASTLADMGDFTNATVYFTAYIKFNPKDSEAFDNRGWCRTELGDYEGALSDCHEAVALDAKSASAYNNLAWLMAVCPEARYRNGKEAVEDAQQACTLTRWEDPTFLDTLAAAYAEAGDFGAAVKWEKQAMINIPRGDIAEALEALRCYEKGLPYREGPDSAPKATNASTLP